MYAIWQETPNEDYFEQNCTPAACELNQYNSLPNAELWPWFEQLTGWQQAGLEALVVDLLKSMPVTYVQAFVAFRSHLLTLEAVLRQKLEAAHGHSGRS